MKYIIVLLFCTPLSIFSWFSSNENREAPKTEQLNQMVLAGGSLVITEIMHQPDAVDDSVGEYFEIYNNTAAPIDLNNYFFAGDGGDFFEIFFPLNIGAGEYLVLGAESNTSINGGVLVDFEYGYSNFKLSDTSDFIIIFDDLFSQLDSVGYDNGVSFPDETGSSMSLDPESIDFSANDSGDNWCSSSTVVGGGDEGTPGEENDSCFGPNISLMSSMYVNSCNCCCEEESQSGTQSGGYGGY